MERTSNSPVSNPPSEPASSPPSSPAASDSMGAGTADVDAFASATVSRKKKSSRKKRKQVLPMAGGDDMGGEEPPRKYKKAKQRRKQPSQPGSHVESKGGGSSAAAGDDARPTKKARKQGRRGPPQEREGLSAAQQMVVNEQMRRALEEDQYSANGSIVDTDSEDDDNECSFHGTTIRMDRTSLLAAVRKHIWMERMSGLGSTTVASVAPEEEEETDGDIRRGRKKKKKTKRKEDTGAVDVGKEPGRADHVMAPAVVAPEATSDDFERDEGSIFGQTTGSSNSTWVECDKCKKWRRLRGVVDEKKLPSKWYCTMNKNDPERARCSAPEEEYETSHTPESAADARTRKHLRVWVRRLQCNEAYEARQPTLTRGKKRAATSSSKEPYEWVRCCNPSCGKWRALLRIMDPKSNVIDRTANGEWYCVMNTWDEKTASCAAPQENLPAVGCPPWVMQDE